jgi:putative endonuclease
MLGWWRNLGRGHLALGSGGERIAARFLRRRGYRIVHRNHRAAGVEADLIALAPDGRTMVIVEVKTRRGDSVAAEDRIDRHKQMRLARLAIQLQRERRFVDRPVRFDSVAIVWPRRGRPEVRHIEAAFDSPF